MGVTKKMISPGNGTDKAQAGDTITMEYTGNLQDVNAPDGKGKQFDSSVGRGDFQTRIGVGQVIKGKQCLDTNLVCVANRLIGWDEGVLSTDGGMTLGEKSTLTITG